MARSFERASQSGESHFGRAKGGPVPGRQTFFAWVYTTTQGKEGNGSGGSPPGAFLQHRKEESGKS
ncbi:hypothetical protein DW741_01095 [Ruminococcaceae bacterium AM28-23LB]|nr:hypothetical protein DW741_01095 [Ruminococcaceae bacterium AM28-23LB]